MKRICAFVVLAISAFSDLALSDVSLQKGILCNVDFFKRSLEEQNTIKLIGGVFKENSVKTPLSCIGWGGFGLEDWFEVSRNNEVYGVNLSTKKYLGSWKLTPYPDHLFIAGEYAAAASIIAAFHSEEFAKPSSPLAPAGELKPFYFPSQENDIKYSVGCLESAPLRFGDVDSDGVSEVVLFLGKNIIIFSSALKKVAFSMHYYLTDELTAKDDVSSDIKHDQQDDPIYLAASTVDANEIGKGGLFSAWRSLSKIYMDSFSDVASRDIVLWRKLYQSRLNKDPIKGFEKLGDVYVHYKLINGEYQKQATPEETIKSWLTAKQLTWQRGYPSKSECPGQEGQLIPEMHDPLLNDPDVLQ